MSEAPASRVRLGLVQMSCSEDVNANLNRALFLIAEAARQGAQIVCLPELFRWQYFCQEADENLFDLAEPIPGPTSNALADAAKESGIVVVGSVFERRAAGIYHNTAIVMDADGTLLGMYRKMHVPEDPLYYEKFYFTPGDLGVGVFETRFGKVAPLICWDQWFPEAARLAALAGAEIVVYPTAIGWHPDELDALGAEQLDAWRTIQRSHAIANGLFVGVVNRTGLERPLDDSPNRPAGYRGIEFWGGSFVAGPSGAVITDAGRGEQVVIADCDRSVIESIRRAWPFLRDRRIDAYDGLLRRTQNR